MARLWSSGFELNSLVAGVEFDTTDTSCSISTTTVNSGTYALHAFTTSGSGIVKHAFNASNISDTTYYVRFYFNLHANVAVDTGIIDILQLDGITRKATLKVTSTRTFQLFDGAFSAVGSASSAVSLDQWNYLELSYKDNTGTGKSELTARLNGAQFASTTIDTSVGGVATVKFGNTSGTTNFDAYFDDLAINDSTGSFQNSWPGAGSIIHLQPPATLGAGDSTLWTPDTGSNFARVREVTPDDATSYVQDSTLNNSDFYKLVASGIGASDTVNVVQVGVRFRNDVADATTAFKVQIEKASGGTIAQSPAIIANSTTWNTNAIALPFNYPVLATNSNYLDPDGSAWTQATLDTMQIGVKTTAVGTHKNQISTIWALVDSTPAAGTTTSTSTSSSTSTSTSTSSTSSSTSSTSSSTSSTSTSTTQSGTTTSVSTSSSTSVSTSSTSSSTSSTSASTSTTTIAPGTIRAATLHRWHRMSPLARLLGV